MSFDPVSRLTSGARTLGIDVPLEGIERLALYFQELEKWSRKINLIGKKMDPSQIIENHFLDSLILVPFLQPPQTHLLDIGSGAGFPGLVCGAVVHEMKLTLVEPRKKRVDFLNHVVRTLDLKHVVVQECRIEDEAAVPSRSGFTHITARGVAEVETLLTMADRFVVDRPELICMKGPRWKEELEKSGDILASSPYRLKRTFSTKLPYSDAKRTLLFFEPR